MGMLVLRRNDAQIETAFDLLLEILETFGHGQTVFVEPDAKDRGFIFGVRDRTEVRAERMALRICQWKRTGGLAQPARGYVVVHQRQRHSAGETHPDDSHPLLVVLVILRNTIAKI